MKIEEGKYYKTAAGWQAGPAERALVLFGHEGRRPGWSLRLSGVSRHYDDDGTCVEIGPSATLVAEWGKEPEEQPEPPAHDPPPYPSMTIQQARIEAFRLYFANGGRYEFLDSDIGLVNRMANFIVKGLRNNWPA